MRPVLTLLRKERMQHGITLGAAWVVSTLVALLLSFSESEQARSLTPLSATARYAIAWLPLMALVLGNRLVVVEYYSRTQLFLETVPLSRLQMVWVKFGLGFAFLLSLGAVSLGLSLWLAADFEPIDAIFAWRLGARLAAYSFAIWGICFVMGFVGRWRGFAWGMIAFALAMVSHLYQWDATRAAPMVLVSLEQFGLVRGPLSTSVLAGSLSLGAAGLLLAMGLATVREGSLAETLAKRLSHRDFSAMVMIGAASVMAASLLPERPSPSAYELSAEATLENTSLHLEIGYQRPRHRPVALRLLRLVEHELRDLFALLGKPPQLPIRVVLDGSLDPLHNETDTTSHSGGGILWRSNYTAPQWDPTDATASLLHGVLLMQTDGRATFDAQHWFLDGFSMYWAVKHADAWIMPEDAPLRVGPEPAHALLARAKRAVTTRPLRAEDIDDWARLSERESDDGAGAIGYSLVEYLARRHSEASVHRLARRVLGEAAPRDVRAATSEWLDPMSDRFAAVTGQSWQAFVDEWRQWLEDEASVQDPWTFEERGTLSVQRREGAQVVVYEFELEGNFPPQTLCTIAYAELPPFDLPNLGRLRRTEHLCSEVNGVPQELQGALAEGGRLFAALEVEHHPTRYHSRLLARRLESQP